MDVKRGNPLAAPFDYFYYGDSKVGRAQADADEIVQYLTKQLAIVDKEKREIREQVLLEYERRAAEAKLDGLEVPKPRCSDCAGLIQDVLESNPAAIVVDGVDEVAESRRHELLMSLVRIRDETLSVIKILLSSRECSNIFAHLSNADRLRVHEDDTQQDMELYVRHRVSTVIANRNLLDVDVPEDLQKDLVSFLVDLAGEMFLWVNLQIERFCELKSKASILDALRHDSKATTAAISQLYSGILGRISRTDPMAYAIATMAFSWLMCMREPLSLEAFLAAVSTSNSDAPLELTMPELLRICSNLIVLDSKLDTLRFAHSSLKEFLEEIGFSKSTTNSVVAMCCLDSCINDLPGDVKTELRPEK
ncbi:Ankyrin repeat protein [Aspergillus sp. HF37]|nr:Ankyrin repeat protein [Aspergillus sp. HF37]